MGLTPLLLGLILWQVLGDPESVTFPPPLSWMGALNELAVHGELGPALAHTLWTFAVSLILATIFGVLLGSVLGARPGVERTCSTLIEVLRNTPPPVIVPVIALLWGTGFGPAVAFVVVASIWPILLNTVSGIRGMNARLTDVAVIFSLSAGERFIKLQLPAVLPNTLVGVRLAAPLALIFTLFDEMVSNTGGLGALLLRAQQNYASAEVFGILVIVGALGFVVNFVLVRAEQRLSRRWPSTLASTVRTA